MKIPTYDQVMAMDFTVANLDIHVDKEEREEVDGSDFEYILSEFCAGQNNPILSARGSFTLAEPGGISKQFGFSVEGGRNYQNAYEFNNPVRLYEFDGNIVGVDGADYQELEDIDAALENQLGEVDWESLVEEKLPSRRPVEFLDGITIKSNDPARICLDSCHRKPLVFAGNEIAYAMDSALGHFVDDMNEMASENHFYVYKSDSGKWIFYHTFGRYELGGCAYYRRVGVYTDLLHFSKFFGEGSLADELREIIKENVCC